MKLTHDIGDHDRSDHDRSVRRGLRVLVLLTSMALAVLTGLPGTCMAAETSASTPGHPAGWRSDAQPSLSLSAVDLSQYPSASLVAQVGAILPVDGSSLPLEAFDVSVDGVPVADLAVSGTESRQIPSSTVLLLDESGSMEGSAISEAISAARGYIATIRPGDLLAIHSFSASFRVIHELSSDQPALSASLDGITLQHDTNLYDSVARSLRSLAQQPATRCRYLILLSDGGDTNSVLTLDQLMTLARTSGVQIYAIGLKSRDFNSAPLEQIARASGGRYVETPDPESLSSLYVSLARELQNKYLLSFTLAPPSKGSSTGQITVQVTSHGASASATGGFLYPSPPTTKKPQVYAGNRESFVAGWMSSFAGWQGSLYVIPIIIAALLFLGLYLLGGVIAPKRNMLREYDDILDNRRRLDPRPTDEGTKPRLLDRVVRSVLRIRHLEDPIQRRIEDAGWRVRTAEFVFAHLVVVLAAAIIPQLLGASLTVTVVVAILAILIPLALLDRTARARRRAFEAQVPDTLTIIASSLRAGQGFEQALQVVADESADPTAHEFRRLLAQQRLGVSPEETLSVLAKRMRSEAFDWVVMVTIIQRQVGGNLAELYERIAETLRDRTRLKRQSQILTAEGRVSAMVLSLLPFFVAGAGLLVNRPYMALLFTTRGGLIAGSLALLDMVVGMLWLSRIARVEG